MAGLSAAAHARERGADVVVYEKGDRTGGAMLLSSGVIWRHRDFDAFRGECPGGDPELQRLVFDRLDGDLAWLESLGARVTERETGNPRTAGMRFDTRSLTGALVAAAGGLAADADGGGGAVGTGPLRPPLRELPARAPGGLAPRGLPGHPPPPRGDNTPPAGSPPLRAPP